MKHFTIIDGKTGDILQTPTATDEQIKAFADAGYVVVDGTFDRRWQRYDLEKKAIVEFRPPKPDDDHEWSDDEKTWKVKPDIAIETVKRVGATAQLNSIDLLSIRAMREAVLELLPDNNQTKRRLLGIESEAESQRELVQQVDAAREARRKNREERKR